MEDDKKCELGFFLKIISNVFWFTNINQKLLQFETRNMFYYYFIQ